MHCIRARARTHTHSKARTYARTRARTHTHTHTHTLTHARTHTCTRTHTHTYTHTHTHARTHARTHKHGKLNQTSKRTSTKLEKQTNQFYIPFWQRPGRNRQHFKSPQQNWQHNGYLEIVKYLLSGTRKKEVATEDHCGMAPVMPWDDSQYR